MVKKGDTIEFKEGIGIVTGVEKSGNHVLIVGRCSKGLGKSIIMWDTKYGHTTELEYYRGLVRIFRGEKNIICV